jgi:hypothetical protein
MLAFQRIERANLAQGIIAMPLYLLPGVFAGSNGGLSKAETIPTMTRN